MDAQDTEGNTYDIEIQRSNAGATPRRARFHAGITDMNVLSAREDFRQLPNTYIIFITERDVLGKAQPLYSIDRYVDGNELFHDGLQILYVNGEIQNDTELGWLMHDFQCTDPSEMHYEILRERAHYLKETKEGLRTMSMIGDEFREEGRKEGRTEGRTEVLAQMLAEKILSPEQIMQHFHLTEEEVQKIEQNAHPS